MGLDKKMSEFDEVTSLEEGHFVPVTREDTDPKLNQKISRDNLALQLGQEAWFDGGALTVEMFEAGAFIDGNPMIKEIAFVTLPVGAAVSRMLLVVEEDFAGPALTSALLELFNDSENFLAGGLMDDLLDGVSAPTYKMSSLSYTDKSGKMFTTGTELRMRLTTDIDIADLTGGSVRVFYKLERIPIDLSS